LTNKNKWVCNILGQLYFPFMLDFLTYHSKWYAVDLADLFLTVSGYIWRWGHTYTYIIIIIIIIVTIIIRLYVYMAMWGGHSMLLTNGEGTGTPNVRIKAGLTVRGDLRFHRTAGFKYGPSVVVLKVFSTAKRPTRLRLIRPYCSLRGQHNQGKGYSSLTSTQKPRVSNCCLVYPTSLFMQSCLPLVWKCKFFS